MEPFSVTNAVPGDVPQLKRIEVDCGLSPWTIASYESEFVRHDSVIIKAERPGEIVGFILGRVPPEGAEAEIYNLGVAPPFQRQGIGSMLLQSFFNLCIERGSPVIWLEVRASNLSAIDFYGSLGFHRKGVRVSFYSNPSEDAVMMALALA